MYLVYEKYTSKGEHACVIYIQFFAVQDWKENMVVILLDPLIFLVSLIYNPADNNLTRPLGAESFTFTLKIFVASWGTRLHTTHYTLHMIIFLC